MSVLYTNKVKLKVLCCTCTGHSILLERKFQYIVFYYLAFHAEAYYGNSTITNAIYCQYWSLFPLLKLVILIYTNIFSNWIRCIIHCNFDCRYKHVIDWSFILLLFFLTFFDSVKKMVFPFPIIVILHLLLWTQSKTSWQ